MAIGFLSMLTPLDDRIARSVKPESTRIILHPEDYLRLSETRMKKIEAKYGIPVEVIGGEAGLQWHKLNGKSKDEVEDNE
jgi:hypothetical protein